MTSTWGIIGASSTGTAPSKGHATTTRKWLASESRWLAATTEFDSFGQPTAETDPLGNRTERGYDTTHQFVIEERNPLWPTDARHKVLTSWHALCAAPSTETAGVITPSPKNSEAPKMPRMPTA